MDDAQAKVMEESAKVSAHDDLALMAAGETSLLGLLRTLLNPRTLPHVVLMVCGSLVLFLLARNEMEGLAALGFVSIALGYVMTGLLSSFGPVQRWTTLPSDPTNTNGEDGAARRGLLRFVRPFRICVFPVAVGGLSGAFLVSVFGENGAVSGGLDSLPFVLRGLVILWAIVQARSLSSWVSAVSAKRLPDSSPREGGLLLQTVLHGTVLLTVMTGLLMMFTALSGEDVVIEDVVVDNMVFFGVLFLLSGISQFITRHERRLAAGSQPLHKFSGRWLLLTQLFIGWHILTVWRHSAMNPPSVFILAEELMLMLFTVLMAIWGLTSKSVKSNFKIVHDGNALSMGLAFGYAYAGSVAMLTVVLDDVRSVMMVGHGVVLVSLLVIQRSVLKRIIVRHDDEVRITRAVAATASVSANTKPHSIDEPEGSAAVGAVPQSVNPAIEADDVRTVATSEPVDVEWNVDDVEVLADDVDWGERIELD